MSAQAQQAAPPGEALRRLSTGLAQQRAPHSVNKHLSGFLTLTVLVAFAGLCYLLLNGAPLGAMMVGLGLTVTFGLTYQSLGRVLRNDQLSQALLLILKDQADRVTCADLLFAARTLPPHAAAPLPELLRARLVEKLPYASAAELAALEPADRQWLRAQLTAPDTTEALLVAVLFALGTIRDREAQEAIQRLATYGSSERLREVAHDALTPGGEG